MKTLIASLFALLFLTCHLAASTIPYYTIDTIDQKQVSFTDGSVFSFDQIDHMLVWGWEPGDLVRLDYSQSVSPPVIVNDPMPRKAHVFHLYNVSKQLGFHAHLVEEPYLNIVTIVDIDRESGQVSLSDFSVWNIRAHDQRLFNSWTVGDSVLVGRNTFIDARYYDAVLFDVVAHSVAIGIEV